MSMLANAARGLKNMWQSGDEDDYDDDLLDEADERQTTSSSTPRYSAPPSKYSSDKYSSPSYGGGDSPAPRTRNLRTVPIPLRAREKNIYTLRPKNLDEAAIAADYLKSGSAVVMNLETVDNPVAVRIIDFMSGVCYGVEGQGHAMKLGDAIFLFTPTEYEIASDELDYGENRDFFFKNINGTGGNRPAAPQAQPQQPQQQASHPAQSPIAAHIQRGPVPSAVTAGMSPTVAPVRSQSSPNAVAATTPSGYATANYSAPAAPRVAQPAPVSQASAPAPVSVASSPAPVAVASTTPVQLTPASTSTAPSTTTSLQGVASTRTSTLPANSVYGSGGKAHVLIGGGKPANTGTSAPPAQGGNAGGARSWDR
jgi:cell division inhibitor SepF